MSGSKHTSRYTYHLTAEAYTLPILHAARYPSSTVIGVLLSSDTPASSSASSATTDTPNQVTIDDAIPLVHANTSLSPMAEAGLSLIDEYAKAQSKRIVGVYVARDGPEPGLGRAGERILGVLRDKWEGVFGLAIDNDKLGSGQPAYIPYLPTSTSSTSPEFKPVHTIDPDTLPEPFTIPSPDLPQRLLKAIRDQRIHRELRDFDDHLDNPTSNWLENITVKATVKQQLS
ncbi:hypothetical protein IAU60_006577 [Kwoniella sp. DSM 27419]